MARKKKSGRRIKRTRRRAKSRVQKRRVRSQPKRIQKKRRAPATRKRAREKSRAKIERLEKKVRDLVAEKRMTKHALDELTRTQRVRFTEEDEGEEEPDRVSPEVRIPGEEEVRNARGELIGYSLPYILEGVDFDFEDEFSWDEFFDDVGEEENDAYEEDAG